MRTKKVSVGHLLQAGREGRQVKKIYRIKKRSAARKRQIDKPASRKLHCSHAAIEPFKQKKRAKSKMAGKHKQLGT
jgi:hypothetical protein